MATHENNTGDESVEAGPSSRAQRRRDADAYAKLAETIARNKTSNFPEPIFGPRVRDAIRDARRMVKGARSRQIRRLAQLLRESGGIDDLVHAMAGKTPGQMQDKIREAENERWRERLFAEGDSALSALVVEYPDADRTRLRQLLRQTKNKPGAPRAKRAATSLLREIRALERRDPETPLSVSEDPSADVIEGSE